MIVRKLSVIRKLPIPGGFFDDYTQFYSTSETSAVPNRLNQRYRACIEWNKSIIQGKRILDLASHDGRWSFAALKAGAKHVTGIEGRRYLVENSMMTFAKYGISRNKYDFFNGEIFDSLDNIKPGTIDTVLVLGIFYHIENHALLLSKIGRLQPSYAIFDTAIYLDPNPVILIWGEATEGEANAVSVGSGKRGKVVSGAPSKSALDVMFSTFQWTLEYYDWHKAGIQRWDDLVDYHEGWRVTFRVTCRPMEMPSV